MCICYILHAYIYIYILHIYRILAEVELSQCHFEQWCSGGSSPIRGDVGEKVGQSWCRAGLQHTCQSNCNSFYFCSHSTTETIAGSSCYSWNSCCNNATCPISSVYRYKYLYIIYIYTISAVLRDSIQLSCIYIFLSYTYHPCHSLLPSKALWPGPGLAGIHAEGVRSTCCWPFRGHCWSRNYRCEPWFVWTLTCYIYTRMIISASWNIADDMPQEEEEFDPTSLHSMHKVGRCDGWHDAKVQVTQMN